MVHLSCENSGKEHQKEHNAIMSYRFMKIRHIHMDSERFEFKFLQMLLAFFTCNVSIGVRSGSQD